VLRNLQIRDFAIIDAVDLEFAGGLTVLTGETGAGKSILVDALEFIAGGKAGADLIRAGAQRADVTATIDVATTAGELRHLLDEQSISAESELLLRRTVGADGRSRAWLNGQSVPLPVLRQVAEQLIDIHGQHEFQALVRPATQRQLVDGFGKHQSLATAVWSAHSVFSALLKRSLELQSAASERLARLDLLRYQVQELDALNLQANELTELVDERTRVAHHGKLLEAAQQAHASLYESESGNAHALLARSLGTLRQVETMDSQLAALLPLLEEATLRVKDAAHSLTQYLEHLDLDPARQDSIEKRLAALEELARKHRVGIAELSTKHQQLRDELAALENSAADSERLGEQLQTARNQYLEQARRLSVARAAAARGLAKSVSARMQELGMAGGRFFVTVEPSDSNEPSPHGVDRVEFAVTTNPGQPERAIAKVASGGELARLSLAVQVSCLTDKAPCMVFDEVDAGIGGAVAEIVGRELRTLADGAQVLCVTHLPQVASQGHQHLRVTKLSDGKATRTAVTELQDQSRVEELSRMLGGLQITERGRAHATEMLANAGKARATPTQPSGANSSASGTGRKAPKSAP
jgi:DNA repair protein RecN (Recombination protein N)